MASAKQLPNEAMPPPDSEDRREFLKEVAAQRRAEEAAAAERRRRAASREAASSDAKLEQAVKDKEQANKDRQMREAAERAKRQPMFKRGGSVSSASKRADGCATKGKTRGKFV
jgi:membrane protein involved in colicin uptake